MNGVNDNNGERPSWTAQLREMEDLVGEILVDRFQMENVTAETDLFERGLDSMARLELLVVLERQFSVELNEDLTPEFRTLSRIARVLRTAIEARGSVGARS